MGADAWIDFKECKNIVEEVKKITDGKGAHAALVTAASSTGYTEAVDYLRSGGKLMAVGLPAKATLDASIFFTVFKVVLIANLLCAIALTLHHSRASKSFVPIDTVYSVRSEPGDGNQTDFGALLSTCWL